MIITSHQSRLAFVWSLLVATSLLQMPVAFAADVPNSPEPPTTVSSEPAGATNSTNKAAPAAPASVASTAAAPTMSDTDNALPKASDADALKSSISSIADGNPMNLPTLDTQITPPTGWEVFTNTGSLSLLMQQPKPKDTVTTADAKGNAKTKKVEKDYSKPIFQRNITLAAIHQPSPIDEARATELQNQMKVTFTKDPTVTNFTILEHKFFDYRGKNDGLLVYSSMNLGEFQMMQMHVLISGSAKQYLLTYTDLATEFNKSDAQGGAFEKAWNAMVSIQVPGNAPKRWEAYVPFGIAGGVIFVLLLVFWGLRRLVNRVDFEKEADSIYDDDDLGVTQKPRRATAKRATARSARDSSGVRSSSISGFINVSGLSGVSGLWTIPNLQRKATLPKPQASAKPASDNHDEHEHVVSTWDAFSDIEPMTNTSGRGTNSAAKSKQSLRDAFSSDDIKAVSNYF